MNLISLKLQAVCEAHNVKRFYCLRAGKDLLGDWIICASYGRMGQRGQSKRWLCLSQEEAQKKTRQLIHKRLSSEKRIGINYSITHLDMDASLNPQAWVTTQKPPSRFNLKSS